MLIEKSATGRLIFGHSKDDEYVLSAFKIPYGYAVYTSPYALHADAYLVGKFLVVYSVTDHFSTAILRSADQKMVDVRIAQL